MGNPGHGNHWFQGKPTGNGGFCIPQDMPVSCIFSHPILKFTLHILDPDPYMLLLKHQREPNILWMMIEQRGAVISTLQRGQQRSLQHSEPKIQTSWPFQSWSFSSFGAFLMQAVTRCMFHVGTHDVRCNSPKS